MKEKTQQQRQPLKRIRHFNEFRTPLTLEEQAETGSTLYGVWRSFLPERSHVSRHGFGLSACIIWYRRPMIWCTAATGNRPMNDSTKPHSFPEFTSRVCPALCEAACTCNLNGEPVSTKENERSHHRTCLRRWAGYSHRPPKIRTGKKVAVVGSGPSGLAAAQTVKPQRTSV